MSSTLGFYALRRAAADPLSPEERILECLLRNFPEPVAFRVGSGIARRLGNAPPTFTLVVHDPRILRALVFRPSLLRLADAYFRGLIDIDGDLYSALGMKRHFQSLALDLRDRLGLVHDAIRISARPRLQAEAGSAGTSAGADAFAHRHSKRTDRAAIAFHYDVSNRFYQLWLGGGMVYSCAYFQTPRATLEQAQRDKLDLICRKLRLSKGERLLDIGCGWGALVCWAARHYGVRALGITLSQQQLDHARWRIAAEGLQDQVRVELRDYRDLQGERVFDKVASVGMFEHVGLENQALYNATVHRVLRPGGLFLNHGITRDEEGWKKTDETRFINRYVFPDAELDTVSNVQRRMEQTGFEIHDVEGLRPHYALTLRHWVKRLELAVGEAVREVGETRYRIWRTYMAACALQFEDGALGIHQILASRRGAGRYPVPLTRRYLDALAWPSGEGGSERPSILPITAADVA